MSASDKGTAEGLCGKWMPRKKTTCARTPGHGGDCMTAENMRRRREYRSNIELRSLSWGYATW